MSGDDERDHDEEAAYAQLLVDERSRPKYTRRFQLLPMIAVCYHQPANPPEFAAACLWSFEGEDQGQVEDQAGDHIDRTGHQVRVVSPSMVIMGPPLPVPEADPDQPVDDVAEVPAP